MINTYNHKSHIAAAIFVASLAVTLSLSPMGHFGTSDFAFLSPVFSLIFSISFFCYFWFYIKAKGRSLWWMLILAFNLIGIAVIFLLKDKAKEASSPGQV